LNGGTSATYHYDVLSRLTLLADAASLNTTFAYDATNKLTSRNLPNGVDTSYQYDGLDHLTRLTHSKAGNTLADFQYQFNAVNNITQVTDGSGAHNYTYDTRDRLTAATHPDQTNESYTLDDVGNRTASHQGSSYTYQPFNRLTAANSNNYGYDTNGSLTSKSDASGSWTYTWDYENRLLQASKSGGVIVTYAYDALGRRVQRTSSSSGTTKFVYDGADVVRDLDASGATTADYLNGPGNDNKLRQTAGGTTSYFVPDRLGTTRGLADSSGTLASSAGYDSYGNVTSGSIPSRYTYTGRESDVDAGLIYYRARWYDPRVGRFLSEDPIGFGGRDVNFYGYVHNDPLRFVDPNGLRRCNPILGAILGGVFGAGAGYGGGAILGAVAGGTIGAAGGTLVIPGFGTITGGASGIAVGAGAGAYAGSVIGAAIGIVEGYRYCDGADTCDKPKADPIPIPAPAPTPSDEEPCYKKYIEETGWCGRTYTDDYIYESCMSNAWRNYIRCKNGLPPNPFLPAR
jgi:RHS repeat-associated protein